MLPEDLVALASLAARTLVTAAVGDTWDATRRGFARLLGRGDRDRAELAEQRLAEARTELTAATPADLDEVQKELTAAWRTRLVDLLEEYPDVAAELRALLDQVQPARPAGDGTATDHGVAAGRDVTISASGGGLAAAVVHGNVGLGPPDPIQPGRAPG